MRLSVQDCEGQGTVEAALIIPVLLVGLLILLQPGIVLYDHIVMYGAAAEACRLAATSDPSQVQAGCEEFMRHRLSAIPQHPVFHVHEGSCSWSVQVQGNEGTMATIVTVKNKLKPLPLIDAALGFAGATDTEGCLPLEVQCTGPTQPGWVISSNGAEPQEWVRQW